MAYKNRWRRRRSVARHRKTALSNGFASCGKIPYQNPLLSVKPELVKNQRRPENRFSVAQIFETSMRIVR